MDVSSIKSGLRLLIEYDPTITMMTFIYFITVLLKL